MNVYTFSLRRASETTRANVLRDNSETILWEACHDPVLRGLPLLYRTLIAPVACHDLRRAASRVKLNFVVAPNPFSHPIDFQNEDVGIEALSNAGGKHTE